MSQSFCDIVCNKPNEEISAEKWIMIESACRAQKVLDENTTLSEQIRADEKTLQDAGITFEQLKDLLHSFILTFKTAKEKTKEETNYTIPFEQVLPDFVPYLHDKTYCNTNNPASQKISLFGNTFIVLGFGRYGHLECPFQDHELDSKIHSYDYGVTEYVVYREDLNEAIHLGALFFHQLNAHHFFQSPGAVQRVDPTKFIRMFSIQSNINYKLPTITKTFARYRGGCSIDEFENNVNWKLDCINDQYSLYRHTGYETWYGIAPAVVPTDKIVCITIDGLHHHVGMKNNWYDTTLTYEVEEICA